MDDPLQRIADHSRAGAKAREAFFQTNADLIRTVAFETSLAIATGHKLLLCGNGGSAADCQHVAGEFVNRFLIDRPGLPAIALTTDTSIITAIGNDSSFNYIFSRQIEALGNPGDILLAISTSGNSPDILAAINTATEKKIATIGLTGQGGGKMAPLCAWLLAVPDKRTPLIQEVHLAFEHIYCNLVDYFLFEHPAELSDALSRIKESNASL